jgi:hypothetical protein
MGRDRVGVRPTMPYEFRLIWEVFMVGVIMLYVSAPQPKPFCHVWDTWSGGFIF